VIESWLNAEPDPRLRSRAFSLYMVVRVNRTAS